MRGLSVKLISGVIMLTTQFGVNGQGAPGNDLTSNAPYVGLSNELIDETLKWVKLKYLCGYDPLELPPVTQDDLNVTYALTISDIKIEGLSHVLRLADVELEKYDRALVEGGELVTSYAVSSTLGIRNVALKFRIEMLKFLSLTVVDFVANGSVPEIDIPLLALVSPSQKHIHFDSISIENLDQLEIDIQSHNFLTFIGGSIPAVKNYIKTHIKDAIKENLENRIGDAKSYLNNLMDSVTSFQQSNRCAASAAIAGNSTGNDTGIRLPPKTVPQVFIVPGNALRGLRNTFGLIIKYRSRVIGYIPLPPGQDSNQNKGLFGYFDAVKGEFVINRNGFPYRHLSSKNDPNWSLSSSKEQNTFCIYAEDDINSTKIKLNPFIITTPD